MSKAIMGAAILGIDAGLLFATGGFGIVGIAAIMQGGGLLGGLTTSLAVAGVSMEAGAIADALTSNRGANITTRQPAAFRQLVYGMQRIGGVQVYQSTTGGSHDQYNFVIVLATHEIYNMTGLYLDGRLVHFEGDAMGPTGYTQSPRNGVYFGGNADGSTYNGPNGQPYNFGGLVFASPWFGDQPDGSVDGNLTANDPTWAAASGKSPWGGGVAYMYLKIEYDQTQFPNLPEIRITLNGKNDIYDPRTSETGFSQNWALCVADMITDPVWGLQDNTVNQAQLIAAANVCDEQIPLAAGGTESQFVLNWHYDTSLAPGDALATMMKNCDGRLSRIMGEWYIWPSYWQGPSFSMDDSLVVGTIKWNSYREPDQLFNYVAGTYIAPNYPYNVAGNLYDSNGWYDGTVENNFPFAFQPTNFPQFAEDTLHGYSTNQFLTDDNNYPLPKEVSYNSVLSVAQAQRVSKIMLLRNRQQGTGTIICNLGAWQLQPTDVFYYTSEAMGWTNKMLEVTQVQFIVDTTKNDKNQDVQAIYVQLSVQETDPSVYTWNPTLGDELTVYDVPASPLQAPYTPAAPTDVVLTSGASTAVVSANGQVTPRIMVTWDAPQDVLVTEIAIQYRPSGTTTWLDAPSASATSTESFITGVIAGSNYDVQIASVRPNGAMSEWIQILDYTVSITLNIQGTDGLAEDALTADTLSSTQAVINVAPFTAIIGSLSVSCLTSPFTIAVDSTVGGSGGYITPGVEYFVYYVDPTFAGGAITPLATTNTSDFENVVGYFLIGAITPNLSVGGGGGGGTGAAYRPSNANDIGTRTTTNPDNAFDGNVATYATVEGVYVPSQTIPNPHGSGGSTTVPAINTTGDCIWEDFPTVTLSYNATLNVYLSATIGGAGQVTVVANVGGTATTLATLTATTATTNYTLTIPSGTNLSTITVEVTAVVTATTAVTNTASVYEIYIQ